MNKFDFIVNSKASNAKYVNGYIIKDGFCELHITDYKYNDYVILFDLIDLEKIKNDFWCCNFIGRLNNKQPVIYCYVKRRKIYLNSLIIRKAYNEKILFKNRNPFDFRRNNLMVNKITGVEGRGNSKKGKELPAHMNRIRQQNGKITGYRTWFKFENEHKEVCFGIRKYKTLENCYQECKKYIDEHVYVEH